MVNDLLTLQMYLIKFTLKEVNFNKVTKYMYTNW